MSENGNGLNILKISATITLMLAVIAPMWQAIGTNAKGVESLEVALRRDIDRMQVEINDLKIHSSTESASKFADLYANFRETETQFRKDKEISTIQITTLQDEVKRLRERVR